MLYELDANAVVTEETFTCYNCGKAALFTVWRTLKYTESDSSNLGHNVKYSDGTMVDGETKGDVDEGEPEVNAYYTGNHWTKAVCTQGEILSPVLTNVVLNELDWWIKSQWKEFHKEFKNYLRNSTTRRAIEV